MDLSITEDQLMDQQYINEEGSHLDLCYELIFPYLPLNDLVSAADSTKLIKRNAKWVFFREFENKQISMIVLFL